MSSSPCNSSKLTQNTTQECGQNDLTSFRVILAPSALLILAILVGNSLVIASYKINRRLRTRTNAFLVSLAISDSLVGSVSLPMWIYMIMMEWNVSSAFKAVFKSFDVFSALASIFHLTAISVERYIAVSRPFYYKRLSSVFHRALIAAAWSAAVFLALLSSFTALGNNWSSKLYSIVLFFCGFALPTAIITCMYVGVFSVARSLLQRYPSRAAKRLQSWGSLKQYYQGESKVAITVALITCLFIAAWVPFFAVSVTAAFCLKCLPSSPDSLFSLIVTVKIVHYMNSAVNPLVYARRDREMRRTFLRLIGVRCGICRLDIEEETPWGFPRRKL